MADPSLQGDAVKANINSAVIQGDAKALRAALESPLAAIGTYEKFYWYWMQALKHYPGHCEVFEVLREFGSTKHEQQTAWKLGSEHKMEMRDEVELQWFAEHFGIPQEETGLHFFSPKPTLPYTPISAESSTFPPAPRAMYEYAKVLGRLMYESVSNI